MANLKETRNRIASVQSTQQITKAMKMVAAAKLRRAQERIVNMRPYAAKLREVLSNLSDSVEGSDAEVYFKKRDLHRVLFVVVAADRGLCGSFNNALGKAAVNYIQTHFPQMNKDGQVDVLTVGKRAREYTAKRGYNVIETHDGFFNRIDLEEANQIAQGVIDRFLKGHHQEVYLAFNSFYNPAVYTQEVHQFLPVSDVKAENAAPKDGEASTNAFFHDYIFEPSKGGILDDLVPLTLRTNFYSALLDSNAAEHGARMTAMDSATDNAGELLSNLRIEYNKARQASITNEILEIVSGANALDG